MTVSVGIGAEGSLLGWVRMPISSGALVNVLCVFLTVSILMASSARAETQAQRVYAVRQAESVVGFTIHGRALLPIKKEGRFKEFAGEVSYDPGHPTDARVELTVYTNSVDMNDPDQDRLLISGDFFDAEHYPTLHFAGAVAGVRPDGTLTVTGDLTIRGVTRRISAPVTFRSIGLQQAAVFETSFQIDRTDFGLNRTPTWRGFNVSVAKNVEIHIAVAAVGNRTPPER